jgi:hypothetical protein
MKKLILFLALISLSCTKDNCDDKLKELYQKKYNALSYAQTSNQIQSIEKQFDNEERKILSNCK